MENVTIQVSAKPVLTVPASLVKRLGVRKGQHVSVDVRAGTIRVRKNGKRNLPALTRSRRKLPARRISTFADLAGVIPAKPGAPKVNIEELMSHHGYEQLERPER